MPNYDKFCKCGCGRKVEVKAFHKYYGVPDFCNGHYWIGKTTHRKGVTMEKEFGEKRALAIKLRISRNTRKAMQDPEIIAKCKAPHVGQHPWNYEERESRACKCGCGIEFKCRVSSKQKFLWGHNVKFLYGNLSGEDRDRAIKQLISRVRKYDKPSSYEQKIIDLCKKHSLDYLYTGSGKNLTSIGGKYPDFINVNGKKTLVEVYSKYHIGTLKHRNYCESRIRHFDKFGYKVLFFNEEDLFRPDWEKHCLSKFK